MSFTLPVTPTTPSRCSKMTLPFTPPEYKILGLSRDTVPSEDESSNAVSREEQKIRPPYFGAKTIKISKSKARSDRSNTTAQKSKAHPSCGRKSYEPPVELEAHKYTFEDSQKTSSKNTPPDENCDTTLNPARQFSSGVVAERPSQGSFGQSSQGASGQFSQGKSGQSSRRVSGQSSRRVSGQSSRRVSGQSSRRVSGQSSQGVFAHQDDIETATELQANQTAFRSLDPAQEQDLSRQQTKSSSHSDDALPPPKQATRRSKRTSSLTNKTSSPTNKESVAEQPQKADTEQSDDDGDEGPNIAEDKPSTEASADNRAKKVTAFHNKLRKALEEDLSVLEEEGFVYLFSDPLRPELLKIGHSNEPERRADEIARTCNHKVEEVGKIWVSCRKRTERLAKAYFSDFCRKHPCLTCSKEHTEWFEIAREPATAALVKWKTFMDTEKPYDLITGQLRPFFRDWIRKQEPFFAGGEGKATREHWDRILVTTWIDRFRFRFNIVWELFWKLYWQINTMFAWTVTFLVVRDRLTFLLLGASVVGTFVCMSSDHNQPRSRLKSPRKVSGK